MVFIYIYYDMIYEMREILQAFSLNLSFKFLAYSYSRGIHWGLLYIYIVHVPSAGATNLTTPSHSGHHPSPQEAAFSITT